MKTAPKASSKPEHAKPVVPGRSGWDVLLLLATAVGVLFLLAGVTALFARLVLSSPWAYRIPPSLLALMTCMSILGTMSLCILAFFRGRSDARKVVLPPNGGAGGLAKPYPEHAVVRTLVPKIDEKGRPVKAGTIGTIVHIHQTGASEAPAYMVEVVLIDDKGIGSDSHLFDARHEELEPSPSPPPK